MKLYLSLLQNVNVELLQSEKYLDQITSLNQPLGIQPWKKWIIGGFN